MSCKQLPQRPSGHWCSQSTLSRLPFSRLLKLHGHHCNSCRIVSSPPLDLIEANLLSTTTTTLTLTGPQITTFAPNITFRASPVNVTASPVTVVARNAKPKPRYIVPRQGFNQTSIYADEVPAYATYCPDASAYSSACSCIGITQTTITAAAATFVSTVVETLTPITTVTPVITYTPTVVITSTVTITPITCSAGKTLCGDTCVDLTQDDDNCGACSNAVSPSPPFLISPNTKKTSQCSTGLICGQSSCVLPSIYFCSPTNQQKCGAPSCGGRCFASVTGQGYCKAVLKCAGLQHCTTGDECPGTVCLKNNCGTVCAGSEYLCANNGTAKMLFRKREEVEGRANLVESEIGWVDEGELGYGGGSGQY